MHKPNNINSLKTSKFCENQDKISQIIAGNSGISYHMNGFFSPKTVILSKIKCDFTFFHDYCILSLQIHLIFLFFEMNFDFEF
jgi:hypothetical protein